MKTVLCYGDSNTFGYDPRNGLRYPKEIRWTTILQELLTDEYEVIVEGLNGRTTAYDRPDGYYKNGLPYLTPCLASHKPIDFIVFMLGTNDCNSDLHLSSNDIAKGMEKLIVTTKEFIPSIQDSQPKIIIVVPAAIGNDFKSSPFVDQLDEESVQKSKEIASLYRDIANKYQTEYLDCSNLEVSPLDSEHLTIEAHNKLAHLVVDKIKE